MPPERLGRALGWFGSLQAAGQTSAPVVGGLAAELDWRLAFVGVTLVAVLLGLVGIPSAGARSAQRPALRTALRPIVRHVIGAVLALPKQPQPTPLPRRRSRNAVKPVTASMATIP